MKQQTKSKLLAVLNTLMLIMLFAIPVYAYWAGVINGSSANNNERIDIGAGQEITTVIEFDKTVVGEGNLVPSGFAKEGTDDIEQVVLTFEVLWTDTDKASHGAVGELTITTSFGENPGANLLNVDVNGENSDGVVTAAITAGTPQTIKLTITLTEPANKAQYELVANETFTLEITFSIEVE